ncbi:MAG: hypothetical protein OXU66_13640 [Gammaproteobacteria bacterium]|nr:hypothetical protein [Gammaproteobacteria bacterium]MDD9897343.1 hypothetical protein [Gammaproteobacteria bacterium]MDD9959962.1 hypothetical protein [Gammaproteobacteria bacterium]
MSLYAQASLAADPLTTPISISDGSPIFDLATDTNDGNAVELSECTLFDATTNLDE